MQVERADRDDLVAVDELARVRRRRSPGRRRRRRPARRRRRARAPPRCRPSGCGRPAAVVDVAAVGRGVEHVDVGAERARTPRGATACAAPLAQSTTTRSPSRRRPSSVDDQRSRRSDRRHPFVDRHVDRAATTGSTVELVEARRSISRLDLVGELAPAGGEQLDAVVGVRVVRRGDHRRRHVRARREAYATAGVGSTPSSVDVAHLRRRARRPARPRARARLAGVAADHERAASRAPRAAARPRRRTQLGRSARVGRRRGRRRCRSAAGLRSDLAVGSALGVLRSLAGLLEAVLLALLLARRRG